jgi:hypothetical protein
MNCNKLILIIYQIDTYFFFTKKVIQNDILCLYSILNQIAAIYVSNQKKRKFFSITTINGHLNTLHTALIFLDQKITVRISALAEGSDPRVECETRAAGVAIGKFVR